ncbi:unnamed protein product [Camellia sinensis]
MGELEVEKHVNYIFSVEKVTWGEVDTSMDKINVDKAVKYFVSCKNLDGGFGCSPGAESHAAQRVKSGGLNGRPEKLPDDKEKGGISDRPDDAVDVFHTFLESL